MPLSTISLNMPTRRNRKGQPLTEEEKAEIEALKQRSDDDIVYDEDCPKLTVEQLKQFKRVNPRPKKAAS